MKSMGTKSRKRELSDGDILEFSTSTDKFYAIFVGNNMVVHSVEDCDLGKENRKDSFSLFLPLSTIKLEKIEDVFRERRTTNVEPIESFATRNGVFQRLETPEEISKNALLSIGSKTYQNSREFVQSCCYDYRISPFKMAALLALGIYFIFQPSTLKFLAEFLQSSCMLMLRYSYFILVVCFFVTYIVLMITNETTAKRQITKRRSAKEEKCNRPTGDYATQVLKCVDGELLRLLHVIVIIGLLVLTLGPILKPLPESLRCDDVCEIKATIDLTGTVTDNMISPHRPEIWPKKNGTRTEIGKVFYVEKFTDGVKQYEGKHLPSYSKYCCTKGEHLDSISKTWWTFDVFAALHLVFGGIEPSHTIL